MSGNSFLLQQLPQPQRLALAYASARTRPITFSLLALDARLARILRSRRDALGAQLRLAWWRDRLAEAPEEWPEGEPLLEALRAWRHPKCLSPLPGGWEALLADALTPAVIAEFAGERGRAFVCLARELGVDSTSNVEQAARIWALADLAANVSDPDERALVVGQGRDLALPPLPSSLRPLTVLAGLGARALRRSGTPLLSGPRSALLALRIGLIGR